MTRKRLYILTILIGVLAGSAAARVATSYDAIYVFGDSYCDVGNVFIASGGTIPAPPYFLGRFSNGPIWIENVAGYMGLPMEPYLAGGSDFAFGGAWVTEPQVTAFGTIPDVPQQVALYLSLHGNKADPNALYVIEGGGNDILGATGGSPTQLGFKIASGIARAHNCSRKPVRSTFSFPIFSMWGCFRPGRQMQLSPPQRARQPISG